MITKNVTVYLGDGYPVRIPVSQYDTMWRFVFKVVLDGEEWTIPATATVSITGRKANGETFEVPCSRDSSTGRWYVDTDSVMTDVPGAAICEMVIVDGGRRVGAVNFVIKVEEAPNND
jgi:hypothetical protein